MTSFWTVVFAVGAAQGVFLCVALLLRRSANRATTGLLAALVGVATTMILIGALIQALDVPFGGLLSFLNINTELALGPLMMLFARSLVDPGRRLVRGDAVHFVSLVLAVMIYMASLMVLQRPWVLALRLRPDAGKGLDDEVARLTEHLKTRQPWLQPDLSLGQLAGALGTTENRLSSVIREGLDTSFYALLNRCRLAEFERLARDPVQKHRSVLELAYEAGFNSKASFYRVFRESHGTTPTAFREAI